MKFNLAATLFLASISAVAWSSEAQQYDYYSQYNNGYYQQTYQQAYPQNTYYQQYPYQQGYYFEDTYKSASQYGYYTAPTYQAPAYYSQTYYTPEYGTPSYQAPYYPDTSTNYYQQPTQQHPVERSTKTPIDKTQTIIKTTAQSKKAINKSSPSEQKKRFLNQILPLVINENIKIQKKREYLKLILKDLQQKQTLSDEKKVWIKTLAKHYRVSGNILKDSTKQKKLLKHVDSISPAMALAQAANESAWGTSRFSKQGNNLFGIWTYNEKIGIKPLRRSPGKKHFVRKFDSIKDSVVVYIHTLNSHPAYKKLREIRYQAKLQGQILSGTELAKGLEKYSAKGQEYIKMIQAMIKSYDLENLAGSPGNNNNFGLIDIELWFNKKNSNTEEEV
ncbi:MAG: hypothetical protein GY694_00685 [Gammaproteobacteria bacterium]|nr:hypothetical protein [Gammaproteobacteria bacterium]